MRLHFKFSQGLDAFVVKVTEYPQKMKIISGVETSFGTQNVHLCVRAQVGVTYFLEPSMRELVLGCLTEADLHSVLSEENMRRGITNGNTDHGSLSKTHA